MTILKKGLLPLALLCIITLTACTGMPDTSVAAKPEIASPNIVPKISLSDSLSSTLKYFEISSGNFTWNYQEDSATVQTIACGIHPLDLDPVKTEKLSVPEYNRIDFAPYTVSSAAPPNCVIVYEWDISQLGNPESKEYSMTEYEEGFIIDLKPNKVYEIVVEWDESQLEDNGFYGTASYNLITEKYRPMAKASRGSTIL